MKIAIAVAVALLCGIADANVAYGQDVALGQDGPADGNAPKVRVVFHQGAVLGIGNDSLLTYTPETGSVVVQYGDGQVVEGRVAPLSMSAITSGTAWVHGGTLFGLPFDRAKGGCSSEQSTLSSAISGVAAACQAGSGQTLVCTAAQNFLAQAYASFNECIRGLIQQK
jgi:hypothetical protein